MIRTTAFTSDPTARTNIAERVATYLVAPATTSPQLRADELAAARERAAIARARHQSAGQVNPFWLRATPAA